MRIKLQHPRGFGGISGVTPGTVDRSRFYFEIQANNNETIATSEVYNSKQAALDTIKLIEFSDNWDVVDET